MFPVSASELASIQTDLSSVLDKTCVIQRAPDLHDGYGTPGKGTYATINTVNAGMSQPSAGQLANYGFRIGDLAAWQVRLPYGTDVQANDRLVIEGQTLEVQVLLNPHSYPGLSTVIASEVK